MSSRLCSMLACSTFAVAGLAATGCGGAGHASSAPAHRSSSTLPPRDGDQDIDSLGPGPNDSDGDAHPTYGPAPSTAERAAIVALIKRYYAAAASGRDAEACAMLDPLLAEATVEEHAAGKGSRSPRGRTCAQLLAKIFAQHDRELREDVASLQVGWIQLQVRQRRRAVALVRFGPTRERIVDLHRGPGTWQMEALFDNGAW
jgi:hypothetical protein